MTKQDNKRKLEIVDSRYQPSRAELEEEFALPDMTPEEALRKLLEPVDVVTVKRQKGR